MQTLDTKSEREILFRQLDQLEHKAEAGLEAATRFVPLELNPFLGLQLGTVGRRVAEEALQTARDEESYKVHGDAVSGRLRALDQFCSSVEERLAAEAVCKLAQGTSALSELYSCLDALTPFYLPKIDALSRQRQQVLVTFADPRPPRLYQSIAEITRASRCPASSVAIVLSQLSQLGFLERQEATDSKSPLYTVKDPAFHAFLIMRHGRRGDLCVEMFEILAEKVNTARQDN